MLYFMDSSNYNNSLVVLIAGSSTRFSNTHTVKKQFIFVGEKPLFIHTLENLTKSNIFKSIVVVCQKEYFDDVDKYIKLYFANSNNQKMKSLNIDIILGGESRVHSVYNAIKFLSDKNIDYVFIHDGVRPIVSEEEMLLLNDSVVKTNAAILAIKMTDTVKQVDSSNTIVQTLDREFLYRAATPQAFLFSKYSSAIEKYMNESSVLEVTDDAQIYSMYEGDVSIVSCSSKNIKITTEDDISLVF